MDTSLQNYYESLLSLFSTDGWKQFQEDIGNSLKNLDSLSALNTAEEFWMRKGQVNILSFIVGYENAARSAYEELTNESE